MLGFLAIPRTNIKDNFGVDDQGHGLPLGSPEHCSVWWRPGTHHRNWRVSQRPGPPKPCWAPLRRPQPVRIVASSQGLRQCEYMRLVHCPIVPTLHSDCNLIQELANTERTDLGSLYPVRPGLKSLWINQRSRSSFPTVFSVHGCGIQSHIIKQ